MNKNLHATLYAKKHKSIELCVKDAIDLDDNCYVYQDGTTQSIGDQSSQIGGSNSTMVVEYVALYEVSMEAV